ncbi:MAG: hypothetical protein OEW18_14250 [Candidatus Aminicenantes bacterium]|nr:hypothetical protein [Candidatus Aminicenantes bacterium]
MLDQKEGALFADFFARMTICSSDDFGGLGRRFFPRQIKGDEHEYSPF